MRPAIFRATMVLSLSVSLLQAQQPTPQLPQSSGADPLAVGKTAMQTGDFSTARTFFAKFVEDNPKDAEAWFYLGGADLTLEHPVDAAKDFQQCVALKPDAWSAHNNLSLAYAEEGDWSAFDKERAAIKAARDKNEPGVSFDDHDVIDVLHVNGETYQVWYFYKLHGHFNVRYVAIRFDKDSKAGSWIQAESDDVDQAFFQQKHPKEAAAGARSFSLDSYEQGKNGYPSQALHKFYPNGEPTYEQFRADAACEQSDKLVAWSALSLKRYRIAESTSLK